MSDNEHRVVYLLHGIRDFGGWTTRFISVFARNNIEARNKHLGWIGLWPFIVPGQAYADNRSKILEDLKSFRGKELTIIAHSFGTWLITRLLAEDQTVKVKRLILCNGVVPESFRWHELKNVEEIVSICRNRDIWPCLAEIISSRFGATGVRGAQHPRVTDTYFDIGHGDCLTEDFCETHFLPLISSGTQIKSKARRESFPVITLQYLNANRFIIPLTALVLFFGVWFMPTWLRCSVSSCFADVVRTDDFYDSTLDHGPHHYVRNVVQKYSFNYDEDKIVITVPTTDHCKKTNDSNTNDNGNTGSKKSNHSVETQVYDLLSSSGEPLPANVKDDCEDIFEVPVKARSALVRIRYISSDDEPAGSGVWSPFIIVRNLAFEIVPPKQMKVIPTPRELDETVRRPFARLAGQDLNPIAEDAGAKNCIPIDPRNSGRLFKLDCQNLWLMPEGNYLSFHPLGLGHDGDRFLFCFTLQDWPASLNRKKEEECAFRQSPPPKGLLPDDHAPKR